MTSTKLVLIGLMLFAFFSYIWKIIEEQIESRRKNRKRQKENNEFHRMVREMEVSIARQTEIEDSKIKLKHFKTLTEPKSYAWFLMYEFSINDSELFLKSDKEIIELIKTTRILQGRLYHKEMDGIELELNFRTALTTRPFEFAMIEFHEFGHFENISEFENYLWQRYIDDWEGDLETRKSLIIKFKSELGERTKLLNGAFYLTKDQFTEDSQNLYDGHCIFSWFDTFIEIDKENNLIRTFDFAED